MQNSCLKNFVKLWRNICDFALGILEFSALLRGFEKKGAIPFKIPYKIPSLRGSKATEAISRNSKFILRNSKFHVIPQLDWGISVLGNSSFSGG